MKGEPLSAELTPVSATAADDFTTAPLTTAVAVVLRSPRIVLWIPTALALLAFTFFRLFGSHVAVSSFAPQSSGSALGALSGIAAQLGGGLSGVLGGDASESLDFYATLLRSPQLLNELAQHRYRFQVSSTDSSVIEGDLIKLYHIAGDTPEERRRLVVEKLQDRITVSVNRLGNVVTVRVKAPWPVLAQQVNRQMLELVNQFNLDRRQSAASAQRKFVESRVLEARNELMSSEDSLRRFLETNRIYESDPRLALEAARLQRRIDLRQTVYSTLTQSFEEARIEEVRNTPVITVIDEPELYTKRSRNPFVVAAAAFVIGLVGSVALAVLIEAARRSQQANPGQLAEIAALGRGALRKLRSVR